MKKRVQVFVFVVLVVLAVVPAINLTLGNIHNKGEKKWWSGSVLYNIDFALPLTSRLFYPFGVSIDPNQVIIGKDNWLYLGDGYERTLTNTRSGTTVENADIAGKIGLAMKSWEQWLKLKGVSLFRVMLGPDKSTIYPEFLPDWLHPAADSATNVLLAQAGHGLYIDTRPTLRSAKSGFLMPLYYKTDTHWNNLGAWIAFRTFAMEIAGSDSRLRWLTDQQVHIAKINKRQGGDLANFLRIKESLKDSEVIIEIDSEHPIDTEQYDFETGRLISSGGNPIIPDAPFPPLLVKSKYALNQKRVLWLRDSFGNGMAPFMAATFTETLQLSYAATDPAFFARLVDSYQPDYVFITTVERNSRTEWFTNLPPIIVAPGKSKNFMSLSHGSQSFINDLTKVDAVKAHIISGSDPYIAFSLSNPVLSQDASQLVVDLKCGVKKESVPLQVFWRAAGSDFNETNSVRFALRPQMTTIGLSPLSSWAQAGLITDIRIDVESASPGACPLLAINSLELGK